MRAGVGRLESLQFLVVLVQLLRANLMGKGLHIEANISLSYLTALSVSSNNSCLFMRANSTTLSCRNERKIFVDWHTHF